VANGSASALPARWSQRQSHEHGVATVMVTHDHDVLGYCDRVLKMVDGRLAAPALTA
jgi:predicted ABC-type transport system involved in lysophospholipase L1 biosynthesis ATPase subunit